MSEINGQPNIEPSEVIHEVPVKFGDVVAWYGHQGYDGQLFVVLDVRGSMIGGSEIKDIDGLGETLMGQHSFVGRIEPRGSWPLERVLQAYGNFLKQNDPSGVLVDQFLPRAEEVFKGEIAAGQAIYKYRAAESNTAQPE